MDATIATLLRKIGLRGTLSGFHYLIKASLLALEDETYLLHLTKRLYPDVALAFHVTPAQVERSLRTAINLLWDQGCIAIVEELVGYRIKTKPYVGEFIDILSGYLRSNSEHLTTAS